MGVVSTVISLSLTTAKISPNSLQKDSNQLAKSMRDDWRNGYEDVLSKQRELEKTVAELNARVDQLAKSIKENETRLADVQAKTPTYATIKETIDYATQTNSGLQKEAKRVLGELGVSNIRVRD
jgi:peptidoglycan hydrolase CwlO-like protein